MKRNITIKDIAQDVGVSTSTVSCVINDKKNISNDVKQKVLETINRLGYRPNLAARNLVKNTSGQIGLYATNSEYVEKSIFFSELTASILNELAGTNFNLVVGATENEVPGWISYPTNNIDGAIIINPVCDEKYSKEIVQSKIPIVLIGRPEKHLDLISYVDVDNVSITYNITKYLLTLGHREIILLGGPDNFTAAIDQIQGYSMALNEYQIQVNNNLMHFSDFGICSNIDFVAEAVNNYGATAIVATSDNLAVSAVNSIYNMGLSVPKDVSVVCIFETYFSRFYHPNITGVSVNINELGKMATRKLFDIINKRLMRPSHTIIDYTINVRESSAKR